MHVLGESRVLLVILWQFFNTYLWVKLTGFDVEERERVNKKCEVLYCDRPIESALTSTVSARE
jgi:hypothetical protein